MKSDDPVAYLRQALSKDAFELLHHVAGKRLAAGRLTVVDATNVQQGARAQLVQLAREHDVLPVAIVLDVPEQTCFERNAERADRAHLPRNVITRQRKDMTRSLRHLQREGFRKVHHLRGVREIDDAVIAYEKRYNDLTELAGPFDIVGDVHGCRTELEALLTRLGWQLHRDEHGRPVDATHPSGRTAVFVGDLVDRGPDSPGVLRLVMGMVAAGHAICVPGNHEQKLLRRLRARGSSMPVLILTAADGVDDVHEAGEPDLHVVVDAQAGDGLDGPHEQPGPADRVGGVELVAALAGEW